jgi:hypothetical protein
VPKSIFRFEDTSFATSGVAEKYRTADGQIIVQRPGKVYLIVQAPFVASDIAQMTSDGEHFRIAIFKGEDKYRSSSRGTNRRVYSKLDGTTEPATKGNEIRSADVKALSNLRPQHLIDAVLIRPIRSHMRRGCYMRAANSFNQKKDPTSKKRDGARILSAG